MSELQDLLPKSKKLSVLLVDSDADYRLSLVKQLSQAYNLVDDAKDAYDGLSFVKINNYDIIVFDQNIAKMTPLQFVGNVHAIKKDQKYVYVCENSSADELVELINYSITATVKKADGLSKLYEQLIRVNELVYEHKSVVDKLRYEKRLRDEQKQLLETEIKKRGKVLEDLAYERKRIGKLLAENKNLNKNDSGNADELKRIKYYNDVTNIPNKFSLTTDLKETGLKGFIYLNYDHFDMVNSHYSMGIGNKVLKFCANKFSELIPNNAKVYNVSVDEFVILIESPVENEEMVLAQKISTYFCANQIEIDSLLIDATFSIGVTRGDSLALFLQGKLASKESKFYGGNMVTTFDVNSEYMNLQKSEQKWASRISVALKTDAIKAYYQPIVNNVDNSINRYLVLCRLVENGKDIIEAEEFITTAKSVGLITKITRIVIDEAFAYFAQNSFNFTLRISVKDLYENYLLTYLQEKVEKFGVSAGRVYLEFENDITLSNSDNVIAQFQALKEAGFHIGMDDMSSEYSILSRILKADAEFIKIDKSFVQGIEQNKQHQEIVANIVNFAKQNGITTVAERVETKEEQELLKTLGVNFSLGYYIAKPQSGTIGE